MYHEEKLDAQEFYDQAGLGDLYRYEMEKVLARSEGKAESELDNYMIGIDESMWIDAYMNVPNETYYDYDKDYDYLACPTGIVKTRQDENDNRYKQINKFNIGDVVLIHESADRIYEDISKKVYTIEEFGTKMCLLVEFYNPYKQLISINCFARYATKEDLFEYEHGL